MQGTLNGGVPIGERVIDLCPLRAILSEIAKFETLIESTLSKP